MSSKPSVVIVSSSNTKPKSLIKLITNNTSVESEEHEKITHPWEINTKYYKAGVNLIGLTENYVRTPEFNENVEALIVHMDSNKETGLSDLKTWETLEKDCEPDVKLLVSNYCNNNTKITRSKAIEWCLKRGYELIELYSSDMLHPEEDEIILEKTGVERIIEALGTHVWPNLVMKEKQDINKRKVESEPNLDSILNAEGIDEFADLFQQLHVMKDSIQSMPMQQRKQCAEQMVTAFWRAIGGDEEEIVDL